MKDNIRTAEDDRDALIIAICGELCGPGNCESPTEAAIACLQSMRDEEAGYINYCLGVEAERDAAQYALKILSKRVPPANMDRP